MLCQEYAVDVFDLEDFDLMVQAVFVGQTAGPVLAVAQDSELVDQYDVRGIIALLFHGFDQFLKALRGHGGVSPLLVDAAVFPVGFFIPVQIAVGICLLQGQDLFSGAHLVFEVPHSHGPEAVADKAVVQTPEKVSVVNLTGQVQQPFAGYFFESIFDRTFEEPADFLHFVALDPESALGDHGAQIPLQGMRQADALRRGDGDEVVRSEGQGLQCLQARGLYGKAGAGQEIIALFHMQTGFAQSRDHQVFLVGRIVHDQVFGSDHTDLGVIDDAVDGAVDHSRSHSAFVQVEEPVSSHEELPVDIDKDSVNAL